ncbi:MAG: hypothetical protein AAGI53_08385 [Planctomycetota bacterium]
MITTPFNFSPFANVPFFNTPFSTPNFWNQGISSFFGGSPIVNNTGFFGRVPFNGFNAGLNINSGFGTGFNGIQGQFPVNQFPFGQFPINGLGFNTPFNVGPFNQFGFNSFGNGFNTGFGTGFGGINSVVPSFQGFGVNGFGTGLGFNGLGGSNFGGFNGFPFANGFVPSNIFGSIFGQTPVVNGETVETGTVNNSVAGSVNSQINNAQLGYVFPINGVPFGVINTQNIPGLNVNGVVGGQTQAA